MFDFDKQLPPSPVQKKKLLLQVSGDSVITSLNQEVPSIIHVHVLLDPVREVSEEILKEDKKAKNIHTLFSHLESRVLWLFVNSSFCDSTYSLSILRLVEHLLRVLQPGL